MKNNLKSGLRGIRGVWVWVLDMNRLKKKGNSAILNKDGFGIYIVYAIYG